MSRISLFPRQSRLSRAVRGALAILALGATASAWAAGTGELPASAADGAVPLTVTVQPGQSLNDIAKAATQSRDPGVLARAGRALFDANPQAFMKHDASRLKVGATLTVPALDATGAAVVPAAASAASAASGAVAASAPAAASGGTAVAQHGASAPHPGSTVQSAPVAPPAHAAPVSGASAATTAAGAAASVGASAAHGASAIESMQPAAPVAGASGPHVWSGAIQSVPSSASGAVIPPASGSQVPGMNEPAGATPATGASQPRPSSLQQLLALKNRVLMELQKHGIGKPATTNEVTPAPAPAPVAPRPAANDAGASATAPTTGEAASGVAASAVQPASVSAPAQPAAPVVAPARSHEQIDWRPAAVAGAAVIVLAAGFAWRKRRKSRRTDDAGTDTAAAGGIAAATAQAEAAPSVEPELPIRPEMPVARDAASDLNLAAATAAAAEPVEMPATDVSPAPEVTAAHIEQPELPIAHAAVPPVSEAAPVSHDAEPVEKVATEAQAEAHAEKPAETSSGTPIETSAEPGAAMPAEAPVAPAATEAQHAALMQNAISALSSLDMPLPPRTPDEPSLAADEPAAQAGQFDTDKIATNGQAAHRLPIGSIDPAPEHPADQDDEFDWDPDAATPASQAGSPFATSSLPPLGGAQFGALKLDFDLDLPSAPGAALPALTPDELARIARNKLDLASEYVELGDLSGARTLLQEVVDANDAATRDDARALLAKLADEA
ncbi:FimV/HubP family polar landmark protein [Burkholderia contaminans]|uniref:FimV/HubP family polar landmark protein n=1 Tax=Burkholderia contaminans TaxID=488447 RepID=UPI003116CB0F